MSSSFRLRGMPAIVFLSTGQLISLVAGGMTNFSLTIWAWQTTGQATTLALVGVCAFGSMFALTPLAGGGSPPSS